MEPIWFQQQVLSLQLGTLLTRSQSPCKLPHHQMNLQLRSHIHGNLYLKFEPSNARNHPNNLKKEDCNRSLMGHHSCQGRGQDHSGQDRSR